MSQPKVKQFDFNEGQIFGKMDLFCKRVQKLMDMFQTVRQFSALAEHKLEGMTNAFRKSTTPKASGSSSGQAEARIKGSDGDTTDSGSDADETAPVALESGAATASSPSAKAAAGLLLA